MVRGIFQRFLDSSCPGLVPPGESPFGAAKAEAPPFFFADFIIQTWMAGTSPAMTDFLGLLGGTHFAC